MESPAYLFDQFAKQRGLSIEGAKRGLMMQAYAQDGRTLNYCVDALGIARSTAMRIARKLMIDFPDYRPYERMEKDGGERPQPYCRQDEPAHTLPLFGAA